MTTIPQLFATAVERFGTHPALIEPVDDAQVSTLTYQELQERVESFAGYLQQQQIEKGERIMIWSASRANWLVAYFGALLVGMVVVPLDVNTREDFLGRIAETTEAKWLVTTQKQYSGLKQPAVALIPIDELPQGPLDRTQLPTVNEDDLAELVFTSGTTGQPKGVMLSHRNIVSNATTAVEVVDIKEQDRALSILPLSHMLEMTIEIALLYSGASIVYARTLAPDTLLKLLSTQQVTCMILVPQALLLFLNGIEREVRRQRKMKQWEALHRFAANTPFGVRRYLFRDVHKRFGGHFRFFVSGGAYLPPALAQRWEDMGFRVMQGYGATECAPVISATPYQDHNLRSVGKPLPDVEVRIAQDGEILVRGPNVAQGYWKNPEATSAVFKDGWYHTGDLGYLDSANSLYLKGRKKNLIVLANGMNVYPEDIENVLQRDSNLKDVIVIAVNEAEGGPQVHAVLLLDDPEKAKGIIQQANKQLAPHQQIKGFTVWPEKDFPRTHTLKVKRQEVQDQLLAKRGGKTK
ncbi:MAG TPA: AMP-binding protein [Ktedonosporobacter sp.]|nr:AMP-binding protein [Ktedonosporobacter sp.]